MNDHVSKPIDPSVLFETLGRFYKPQESAQVIESKQSQSKPTAPDEIPSIEGLDTKDGLAHELVVIVHFI